MKVGIRPLQQDDLPEASRVFRLAFGTYIGLPDPEAFARGTDPINSRWLTHPHCAFGVEVDGRLVGSNFGARWGSLGFVGPLTIHPDFWDHGLGARLMAPVLDQFAKWSVGHVGLFTRADSAKHLGLYNKCGFWPRFLAPVMSKQVGSDGDDGDWMLYSELPEPDRESCLRACRALTDTVYPGLEVGEEIRAIDAHGLGETLLLWDGAGLSALALCYTGAHTEGGADTAAVKFGVARSQEDFGRLLAACESWAVQRGLLRLRTGVSTARVEAWSRLRRQGFRTDFQGVAMHRPNEPGYCREGVYVLDDWR